MTSSLATLAPELMDRILSYNDTSYLSLPLWLVGNKRLHELLSDSVTYIELRNSGVAEYCILPKYLTNLRSLRHLLVDRFDGMQYFNIYDPLRTSEVISGLPKTMESLILRFSNSKDVFFPLAPDVIPHVPLSSSFPSLLRLQVDIHQQWTPLELKALPRSLTDFHCGVPSDAARVFETLDCLPPEIEILSVMADSAAPILQPAFFQHLPPHIRELNAYCDIPLGILDSTHLAAMPRSLTGINVCSEEHFFLAPGRQSIEGFRTGRFLGLCSFRWTSACGPVAPQHLIRIATEPITNKKDLPKALGALPPNLKSFICGFKLKPKHIRLLPRGLEWLSIKLKDESSLKKEDFPPELKMFALSWDSPQRQPFLALLPSLTSFRSYSRIHMADVSLLPRTITSLELSFEDLCDTVEFPPSLVSLKSWTKYASIFENPGSSEGLVPGKSDKKQKKSKAVKPLPSSVMPEDGAIVVQTFPTWRLPRTMTELSIIQGGSTPASSLVHLPPLLRSLTFNYIFRDSKFVPTDPSLLEAAQNLRTAAGEKDSFDYLVEGSAQPQVTIFDLLPRSLTTFGSGFPRMGASAHSRLPPNLTALQLRTNAPGEDANALFHLSRLPLKELRFFPDEVNDSHLKAVRRVRHLTLVSPPDRHFFTLDGLTSLHTYELSRGVSWLNRINDATLMTSWRNFLAQLTAATQDPSGQALKALLAEKRKND